VAFFSAIVTAVLICTNCVFYLMGENSKIKQNSELSFNDFNSTLPLFVLSFSMQAGGSIILSSMKDKSEINRKYVTLVNFVLVFMVS